MISTEYNIHLNLHYKNYLKVNLKVAVSKLNLPYHIVTFYHLNVIKEIIKFFISGIPNVNTSNDVGAPVPFYKITPSIRKFAIWKM